MAETNMTPYEPMTKAPTEISGDTPGGMSTLPSGGASMAPTTWTIPTTTNVGKTGLSAEAERANTITNISTQLNKIKAEADALAAREENEAGDASSSDTQAVNDEQSASNNLYNSEQNNPTQDALNLLDAEIRRIEAEFRREEQAINQRFDVLRGQQTEQQEGERGQTSVGLATAGGYLGFSGSGTGVMLSLAKSHRAELADLAAKRQQAIAAARAAAEGRRYNLVTQKVAEIQRIDEETFDREKYYNEKTKELADLDLERKDRAQKEEEIFNVIQSTGSKKVEDIYEALKGRVPIAEITSFLEGLVPDIVGEGGFKFTSSNNAALLGAGLDREDIVALNETINENGYTDEVRGMLTPGQRAVVDKIFRDVKGTTGGDSPSEPLDALDVQRLQNVYDVVFPIGITHKEATDFIQETMGWSAAERQQEIDEIFGPQTLEGQVQEQNDNFAITEDNLRLVYDKGDLKDLADALNKSSMWTYKSFDIDRMFEDPDFAKNLTTLIDQQIADFAEISDRKISRKMALDAIIKAN